jgi:hypothetical protein
METIRILQEQYEKESKKANIPVPPIITIDDYDRFVAKDFVRPVQYQKHKGMCPKTFSGFASAGTGPCAVCAGLFECVLIATYFIWYC